MCLFNVKKEKTKRQIPFSRICDPVSSELSRTWISHGSVRIQTEMWFSFWYLWLCVISLISVSQSSRGFSILITSYFQSEISFSSFAFCITWISSSLGSCHLKEEICFGGPCLPIQGRISLKKMCWLLLLFIKQELLSFLSLLSFM